MSPTSSSPLAREPTHAGRPTSSIPIQVGFRTLTQELTLPKSDRSKAASGPEATHGDVHLKTPHEVSLRFGVSLENGLDPTAVTRRRARVGPNALSPPPTDWVRKVLGYLFSGFAAIMWIASIITFIAWQPLGGNNPSPATLALAIVILIVIFLQAIFTGYQDFTSSRIMASINSMLPQSATVTRSSCHETVPVADLVPGDVVHLKYGTKVPADIRLISVSGLKVDNSILTGESLPIHCTVDKTDNNVLESHNMTFMGTFVTEGEATGVVVATGDRTLMGQVALLASRTRITQSTLQKEIISFSLLIGTLACTTATLCFAWYMLALRHWYPTFLDLPTFLSTDMGILVAFTPEGLPIAVTLVLTIIARRMFAQRVLVKNLSVVETLGCCSVLCSDKTGTLTTNQMVVHSAVLGTSDPITVSSTDASTRPKLAVIASAAHICNGARFHSDDLALPIDKRRVEGDATDIAMLRFGHASVADANAQLNSIKRVMHVPFNSKTKRMVTVIAAKNPSAAVPSVVSLLAGNTYAGGDDQVLLVKGAPDLLLPYASAYVDPAANGADVPLDNAALDRIRQLQESLAARGQRVLLIARRVLSGFDKVSGDMADNELLVDELVTGGSSLTVLGLVGIVDPPRPETKDVITTLRKAGVRTFMVTGDHSSTASAIARECGLFTKAATHTFADLNAAVQAECDILNEFTTPEPTSKDTLLPLKEGDRMPLAKLPGNASDDMIRARMRTKASLVLSGADMPHMTLAHWSIACDYEEIVFARTTPEHKLQIVHAFQERGEIVAVTGDGVNDAPALKNANLGVAMGSGSDVAMAASAMVLLNSNLASIVVALREGRVVFENLKKVTLYLIPAGTFSELTPVFVNLFLGVPLPLSGFLMIVICVLTDIFPSLALMYEQAEADLLMRPPRRPKRDRLVDLKFMAHAYFFIGLIESIIAHSLFFLYMYREWGLSIKQLLFAFDQYTEATLGMPQADLNNANAGGQCVYFVTLVILQFGNALAVRTRKMSMFHQSPFKNPALFVAMVASLCVAAVFVYTPIIQSVIGTYPIPALYWVLPVPLAVVVPFLDEVRKWIVRSRPESLLAKLAW
ncbi:hypothetical protein BCR44DRAFT_50870 [Catenaria anguillulae PL171]|uniref:Cation-transporting P-type ATPase N-terminal domain-containing protein n=1 Tax=Catenaria anguillulae PL171 TaxID=765915 RepID=A0A1Y2HPI1_9FUNG|nr:hypothetical protein BCR44DRAFT_50870 [Catenaria anguillulae PL171]